MSPKVENEKKKENNIKKRKRKLPPTTNNNNKNNHNERNPQNIKTKQNKNKNKSFIENSTFPTNTPNLDHLKLSKNSRRQENISHASHPLPPDNSSLHQQPIIRHDKLWYTKHATDRIKVIQVHQDKDEVDFVSAIVIKSDDNQRIGTNINIPANSIYLTRTNTLAETKMGMCHHVPFVPTNREWELPEHLQLQLADAREAGRLMSIPPHLIGMHEDSLCLENKNIKATDTEYGQVWYASRDLIAGVIPQTIPAAISDGFPRQDEFMEKAFTTVVKELKTKGFNVDAFANDIQHFTKDPNLIQFMKCGVPQSYCGRFESIFHPNLPMEENEKEKVRATQQKQQQKDTCSKPLTRKELHETLSKVLKNPIGAILKNSAEKIKASQGFNPKDLRYRSIYHGSMENEQGNSLNNQTYCHKNVFVTFRDIERAILEAVDRLHELGIEDHTDRIRIWKSDISDAYRIVRTAVEDYWLGVWSVNYPNQSTTDNERFIIEKSQQFGQKRSVSIFHRLVYQITSIMSQPGWVKSHFPDQALDNVNFNHRPSAENIEHALKSFREAAAGKGILDPQVWFWIGYYLDDCHGISIDIRNDISSPLDADPVTGIRNPIGNAIATFLDKYGITENIEKRFLENDDLLMGATNSIALGIRVDTNTLKCSVREDYRLTLINIIDNWVTSGPTVARSVTEWGELSGKLTFTMIVYGYFRCLLRPIWRRFASMLHQNMNQTWAPSSETLENLVIMKKVLTENPGRSLRHGKDWRTSFQRGLIYRFKDRSTMDTMGDASTSTGFGFVNTSTGEYYFRKWRGHELVLARHKRIFILEAIVAFIMFGTNLHYLKTSNINMVSDNEGLVKSFHSAGCNANIIVNDIVRSMVLSLCKQDIILNCDKDRFDTSLCDTLEMAGPDALSRGDEHTFLQWANSTFPSIKFKKLSESNIRITIAEQTMKEILEKRMNKKKTKKRKK